MELYRHVDNRTRLEPTLWRARLLQVSVGREVFSCPTAVSPSPWCSRRRQSMGRFSTVFPRVVHLRLGIFSQSTSINLCLYCILVILRWPLKNSSLSAENWGSSLSFACWGAGLRSLQAMVSGEWAQKGIRFCGECGWMGISPTKTGYVYTDWYIHRICEFEQLSELIFFQNWGDRLR